MKPPAKNTILLSHLVQINKSKFDFKRFKMPFSIFLSGGSIQLFKGVDVGR